MTDVATQGRYGGSEYTTTYSLQYLDPYISSPETWRDVKVMAYNVPYFHFIMSTPRPRAQATEPFKKATHPPPHIQYLGRPF